MKRQRTNQHKIILPPLKGNPYGLFLNSLIPSRKIRYRSKGNIPTIKKQPPATIDELNFICNIGKSTIGKISLASRGFDKFAVKQVQKAYQSMATNEWTVLSKLNHPFIVGIFSKLEGKDHVYLVLEYIEGSDLFKLKKTHRFLLKETVFLAAETALAMRYLHKNQVMHRDLKPENLMVDRSGHIKLIDFGLSKNSNTERTFTLCGSPEYLAPEVISGHGYSFQADCWAFGVLLYEMLCGHPPFSGLSVMEMYENIQVGRFVFIKNVDPASRDLISRLLRTNPMDRINFEEVMNHRFFGNVDWNAIENKKLQPAYLPDKN